MISPPKCRPTPPDANSYKHCLYQKNMGHTTEECVTLKDKIKELISVDQLKKYIKTKHPAKRSERSPRHKSSDRREYRGCQRYGGNDRARSEQRRSRSRSRSNDRPLRSHINTISSEFVGGRSLSSAKKRHVRVLRTVHTVDRSKRPCLPSLSWMKISMHPTLSKTTLWSSRWKELGTE